MTDLTPNDLSHLSDEEFNALCPQKEKAKRFQETEEAKKLKDFETVLDLRLDGIAFFLANNPPIKR